MPRRRRHLTLVTSPAPDDQVIVLSVACCQAVAVLRDGRPAVIYHEGDDHCPDSDGIQRELDRHRGDTVPDPHRFDRQSVKYAGAEKAAAEHRVQQIEGLRAALLAALTPTDDDPPKDAS